MEKLCKILQYNNNESFKVQGQINLLQKAFLLKENESIEQKQ